MTENNNATAEFLSQGIDHHFPVRYYKMRVEWRAGRGWNRMDADAIHQYYHM